MAVVIIKHRMVAITTIRELSKSNSTIIRISRGTTISIIEEGNQETTTNTQEDLINRVRTSPRRRINKTEEDKWVVLNSIEAN